MRARAQLSVMLLAFAASGCQVNTPSSAQGGEGGVGGTGGTGGTNGTGGAGATGGTGGSGAESVCELDDGQCIFRHDTFGDEQLWTTALRMNELVETLPPTTALAVGLRVDAAAVPLAVLMAADLDDPATTVALLELDAVVGVHATVVDGDVVAIGVTCALCHSDVDHSIAPGIGNRLDGWPNRDLDVGLIISLQPGLADYATSLGLDPVAVTAAYASWGPGRYDARFNQDLVSAPVLIPPAYGLADVALETYTGDGPISYWNAYVAVTQMGARGNFVDAALGIDIVNVPDMVTAKLPALAAYQHSLAAPVPPADSFDPVAAAAGEVVFAANCASCHSGTSFSDAPNLHEPAAVGQDPAAALRSKTGLYRATPLRGLWQRAPYFHDGGAATVDDVITHYQDLLGFNLTQEARFNLAQYLLSL